MSESGDTKSNSSSRLQLEADASELVGYLRNFSHLAVAFSGGVDSSVVLAAGVRADLSRLVAVTAKSPSVARWQCDLASDIARHLGVEHWVAETNELSLREYQRNDSRRCFYCKQTLYAAIELEIGTRLGASVDAKTVQDKFRIASGTNADDLGDHRPGIQAGVEKAVLTPLASLGLSKERVRALANYWSLPNHDLPASPCLSSRIAYGVEVTPERLERIESAEAWLYERGFREFRVRLHEGELARIEVAKTHQTRLLALDSEGGLSQFFRELGFRFVTVDLQGFHSGSLNRNLVNIGQDLTGTGAGKVVPKAADVSGR